MLGKETIMETHDPPHPGEILRHDCLEPLDLTVTVAAEWLGVSRGSLSAPLNGHNGISAEMAIRLEKAGWSTVETWLRMQLSYDLWHAKQNADQINVAKFPMPQPS